MNPIGVLFSATETLFAADGDRTERARDVDISELSVAEFGELYAQLTGLELPPGFPADREAGRVVAMLCATSELQFQPDSLFAHCLALIEGRAEQIRQGDDNADE